jgi:large subunit ribosomal protein L25
MQKLETEKREIVGKKVKNYRLEGKIPASVYGPKQESENLVLDRKAFLKLFREAGHSKLINVDLDGSITKALIKEVQLNALTREITHASLYAVDMTKEIETDVPVHVVGVAPAVKSGIGFLSINSDKVTVHCLPANLPSEIVVDISTFAEIGDGITAGELNLGEGVTLSYSQSADEMLVAVVPPQKEIVEEEPVVEEVVEGAEGEAKEGEAAKAGGKTEGTDTKE